jgi:hypothetical protein
LRIICRSFKTRVAAPLILVRGAEAIALRETSRQEFPFFPEDANAILNTRKPFEEASLVSRLTHE